MTCDVAAYFLQASLTSTAWLSANGLIPGPSLRAGLAALVLATCGPSDDLK